MVTRVRAPLLFLARHCPTVRPDRVPLFVRLWRDVVSMLGSCEGSHGHWRAGFCGDECVQGSWELTPERKCWVTW